MLDPRRTVIAEAIDATGQVIGYYLQSDAGCTAYLNVHEMNQLIKKTVRDAKNDK